MKRKILQMMLVVGLAACSVCFAQAQNSEHYKTEIPFDFTVGKKQYAAGTYSIEVAGAGQRFFVLRDAGGRNGYFVQATPGTPIDSRGAVLDFHRSGDQHVLAAIRTSDLTSNLRRAVIKGSLAGNQTRQKVTLALSGGK